MISRQGNTDNSNSRIDWVDKIQILSPQKEINFWFPKLKWITSNCKKKITNHWFSNKFNEIHRLLSKPFNFIQMYTQLSFDDIHRLLGKPFHWYIWYCDVTENCMTMIVMSYSSWALWLMITVFFWLLFEGWMKETNITFKYVRAK